MVCLKYVTMLILAALLAVKIPFASSETDYNTNARCIASEREALSDLAKGLIDKAHRLSSWNGKDCCSWQSVSCDNITGHVLKIDLSNPVSFDNDRYFDDEDYFAHFSSNCLGGEISPSLLNLEHLQYLDLSMNNFAGIEIPTFFGSLKNLEYLNLSSAGFGRHVPNSLGNLSSLQYLHVGYAPHVLYSSHFLVQEYGLTADSLSWMAELSSLKSLDLSGVQLSKAKDWLHSLNSLPSLVSLNLAGCELNQFPPLSHINFTSLTSLNLQWNNFNSTIPLWLSNITSLQQLQLDHNSFDGLIPYSFEKFASLAVLDLSSNSFGTQLPITFCKMISLVHMDLSGNNFQGTIPYCFQNLTSLSILNLEANHLDGPIPDSISQMCSLQVFDLSLNQFNSSLPTLIRNPSGCLLNSLKELYLISNDFFGYLPSQLVKYKYLEVLHLSFNSLSGTIPSEISSLSHLRELDISNNNFNGSVPSSFGQLSELVKLDISNNILSGLLSEVHFQQLSKLKDLLLSSNSFLFKVSPLWIPPFQLSTIELESINVGPEFPTWLQTQRGVKRLIMSNASVSDVIPSWFENVYSQIDDLDLSNNNISGRLPRFEEYNGSLRVIKLNSNKFGGTLTSVPLETYLFDLSENSLEGQLPVFDSYLNKSLTHLLLFDNRLTDEIHSSLCEIQSLIVLDLSNNRLSGKIPPCLANLQNLQVLDLSNNSFHGEIPNSLGSIVGIVALHLHHNNLDGKLPSTFQNLKNLRVLDVGENGLKDIIHPWIGSLWDLMFLRLHSNDFHGTIPLQLCQLSSLRTLMLSENNLSGSIPHCFNKFTSLISEDPQMVFHMKFMLYFGARLLESMKGRKLKYTRSLQYLKTIELSENSISGHIPEEMMQLIGLQNLNLSGNHLQGSIPDKIGNLKQLESLGLSRNDLSGPIPASLSTLNSLSHLNLSFNELSGKIPTGNQLQTLNDPSIYEGNEGLCGAPVLKTCPDEETPNGGKSVVDNSGEMETEMIWFYAGFGPGFGFGFMIFYCILFFKNSWRIALFQFVESLFLRFNS